MLPFKKFIVTMLFFNKDVAFISKKLTEFGYSATDKQIGDVLSEIYTILPTSLTDLMKSRTPIDLSTPDKG